MPPLDPPSSSCDVRLLRRRRRDLVQSKEARAQNPSSVAPERKPRCSSRSRAAAAPVPRATSRNAGWSPDGTRLAFFGTVAAIRCSSPTARSRRPADFSRSTEGHAQPQSGLVAGRPVDLLRRTAWTPTEKMDIWRVRPSGGSPERLTEQNTAREFPGAARRADLLYIARAEDGRARGCGRSMSEQRTPRRVSLRPRRNTHRCRPAATAGASSRPSPTRGPACGSVPLLDRSAEERDVQPYPVPTARALAPRFGGASLFYLSSRRTRRRTVAAPGRAGVGSLEGRRRAADRSPPRYRLMAARRRRRQARRQTAPGRSCRRTARTCTNAGAVHRNTGRGRPGHRRLVTRRHMDRGRRQRRRWAGLFKIPGRMAATPVRLVTGQAVNPVWSPDGRPDCVRRPTRRGPDGARSWVRPDGTPVDLPAVRVRPGGYRFLRRWHGSGLPARQRHRSDFWLLDLAAKTTRQLTRLSDRGRIYDIRHHARREADRVRPLARELRHRPDRPAEVSVAHRPRFTLTPDHRSAGIHELVGTTEVRAEQVV